MDSRFFCGNAHTSKGKAEAESINIAAEQQCIKI
jgi:hypothetical protein